MKDLGNSRIEMKSHFLHMCFFQSTLFVHHILKNIDDGVSINSSMQQKATEERVIISTNICHQRTRRGLNVYQSIDPCV